jgi:hypothetical protein
MVIGIEAGASLFMDMDLFKLLPHQMGIVLKSLYMASLAVINEKNKPPCHRFHFVFPTCESGVSARRLGDSARDNTPLILGTECTHPGTPITVVGVIESGNSGGGVIRGGHCGNYGNDGMAIWV